MERKFLIDSNIVIDYLAGRLPNSGMEFLKPIVNQAPNVSVITKIEVLGFNSSEEMHEFLSGFFNDSHVIELTDTVVNKTIDLRRKVKIKTPDAIVAATALSQNLTLLTRNLKDFQAIFGLDCLNPWELEK